jgi:hypothetical protein
MAGWFSQQAELLISPTARLSSNNLHIVDCPAIAICDS